MPRITKPKRAKRELPALLTTLNPDFFYRKSDAWAYFGYRPTQLDEKIKLGEIPRPIDLSDTGRAIGWFGRTILAWQRDRVAKAKGT
jgi:predicted DNA-binding transcriptional regulator AlpA